MAALICVTNILIEHLRSMNDNQTPSGNLALICPSCMAPITGPDGGAINTSGAYFGLVSCLCAQYPVVAGIPVIVEGALPDSTTTSERLVRLIDDGRGPDALLEAVRPAGITDKRVDKARLQRALPAFVAERRLRRADSLLRASWDREFGRLAGSFGPGSTRSLIEHYFSHHGSHERSAGDYFAYKLAQPKHLASLALLSVGDPSAGPSLDIGCGAGHLLRYLSHRASDSHGTIGIDTNFFLLWLAKTRISPRSSYVCCDATAGLPLPTDAVKTTSLSNFFHFPFAKSVLVSEVERVTAEDGIIMLLSLRHTAGPAPVKNRALPPVRYGELFRRPSVTLSEQLVLERYLDGLAPDLTSSHGELGEAPLIDVVLSNDSAIYVDHGAYAAPHLLPHWLGRPAINPLYQALGGVREGMLRLARFWPNNAYMRDNHPIETYLPSEAFISRQGLEALEKGEFREELGPLIAAGVLLDVPRCY